MTSPATHDETVAFFAANDRFGLAEEDLTIFCQGTMPAVDAATGRVAAGGARPAWPLAPTDTAACWRRWPEAAAWQTPGGAGIEQLFYFQVDNPLVEVCGAGVRRLSPALRSGDDQPGDRQARAAGEGGQRRRGGRPAAW